jgi:hypothetical protein
VSSVTASLRAACAICLVTSCHTVELINSEHTLEVEKSEQSIMYINQWDHNVFWALINFRSEPSITENCQTKKWSKVVISETWKTTGINWLMHYVAIFGGAAIGYATGGPSGAIQGFWIGAILIAYPAYNNVTLVYSPVNVDMYCLDS